MGCASSTAERPITISSPIQPNIPNEPMSVHTLGTGIQKPQYLKKAGKAQPFQLQSTERKSGSYALNSREEFSGRNYGELELETRNRAGMNRADSSKSQRQGESSSPEGLDSTTLGRSIQALDELMDMINRSSFLRQSQAIDVKNLSVANVYEEHWDFEPNGERVHSDSTIQSTQEKRISRRISSYYGEIFDHYEYNKANMKNMMSLPRLPKSHPSDLQNADSSVTLHEESIYQTCSLCELPIKSKPVLLLGRYWHKEHSECADCHRPIGIDNFAEIDSLLYCEDHYTRVNGKAVRKEFRKETKFTNELDEIKQNGAVKTVRNLFTVEKDVRVNMLSVIEESWDNVEKKRQRYVLSWMPQAQSPIVV